MVHHVWGDQSFDWDSLYEAIRIGTMIMEKFGRISVSSKEKYGTARWSIHLFNGQMHDLTHPGCWRSQYPQWLWSFDVNYRPLKFLIPIVRAWQKIVIKLTFLYLTRRYLHIVDEIIMDAPREFLTKDLKIRSGRMWQRMCKKCEQNYTLDNDNCPYCGDIND